MRSHTSFLLRVVFPQVLQVESAYLRSPHSLARFTGRNFGRIAVDWSSREVTLSAHDEAGVAKITKRLKLDDMGPGSGGECGSTGRGSTGRGSTALKSVSFFQALFPELSNTQCIVMTIVVYLILLPIIILSVTIRAAFLSRSRANK
jgi:hypothetical protein